MIHTLKSRRNKLLFALLCAALAGCQTTSKKSAVTPFVAPPAPKGNLTLGTDPCATRMEEIGSAMLIYLTLNKKLPATLPELQPMADAGVELKFICPVSGKPYVYVPGGLAVLGQDRVLVLYDEDAVHEGMRWGLVIQLAQGDRPMTVQVIRLDQKVLDAYLKSAVPQ